MTQAITMCFLFPFDKKIQDNAEEIAASINNRPKGPNRSTHCIKMGYLYKEYARLPYDSARKPHSKRY